MNRTEVTNLAEPDVEMLPSFDIKLFARSKDKLWIRIENLADKFDLINGLEKNDVKHVDVEALAQFLFSSANPQYSPAPKPHMEIKELTLSGGDLAELGGLDAWNTGDKPTDAPQPEDQAGNRGAAFPAQRIRMYEVTYQAAIAKENDLVAHEVSQGSSTEVAQSSNATLAVNVTKSEAAAPAPNASGSLQQQSKSQAHLQSHSTKGEINIVQYASSEETSGET